jgi:hypothetical protein
MGNIRFGLPSELTKNIQRVSGIRAAVETGSYHGDSTGVLASLFDQVWAIEISEENLEKARAAVLPRAMGCVEFVSGDSAIMLPVVLAKIDEPACFWLDSHWFPSSQASDLPTDIPQCPLIAELLAIKSWTHHSDSWILIDDMHLFHGLPQQLGYRPAEWPPLSDLGALLTQKFPRHFQLEIEDVLIVCPDRYETWLLHAA